MKKLLIAFIVSLSLSQYTNAQVAYGPIAGLNIATIGGRDSEFAKPQLGIHIGFGVEIPLSDNFLIAPGLLYSMKGAKNDLIKGRDLHMNYIEIPVNAKYRTDGGFNVLAGPYFGILASAKYATGTDDLKSRVTSTDFGFNLGLGVDFQGGFGLSAQYGLGVKNLNTDTRVNNTVTAFGFSLRYMFGRE